jgi:lipopolysaccharide transport system permease protein
MINITERLSAIVSHRRIIKSMVVKNLRGKYIGSALGISWAIINPLLIMLVITFTFSQIMRTEIKHFSILVLSALLPWNFFINSIMESTTAMESNAQLLRQFLMPREAIPISIVMANLVNFLFGFIIVIPIFILFNIGIIKCILILPMIIFLHFIFTLGVCMSFSVINVYFKDFSQLLNTMVMFFFWLTPVFYTLEMIPRSYRWLVLVNPSTCFVDIYRSLLYSGNFGSLFMWALASFFALISIIAGYFLFINKETEVVKRII